MKLSPILPEANAAWPCAPEALADAILGLGAEADEALPGLASFLRAPASELAGSPISLRVAVAAANEGRSFVHHELRLPPPLGPELHPELDVGRPLDDGIGWQHGRLTVPKYFSAFLDAPLPTFDPNHRGKWRPHELLHRLARFSWAPDSSRFAAYLSARLSELLPVVHWYGFDEIGRSHCPVHYGVAPGTAVCVACETAGAPGTPSQRQDHQAHAHRFSGLALAHLQTELDACQRELESGEVVPTPRLGLDASSDAVGYMRSHWNRITAWSFGAWVERFAEPGRDYFESCTEQLAHVRSLAGSLVQSPSEFDVSTATRARQRRWMQDIGYRALLCIEAIDTQAVEDEVLPIVDQLAGLAASPAPPAAAELDLVVADLDRRLRNSTDDAANVVFAGGWSWRPPSEHTVAHVIEGLRTALVRSLEPVDEALLVATASAFVEHAIFWEPGEVFARFARFLGESEHSASGWVEAVRLEAWLLASPVVDLEAERFAAVPDAGTDLGAGRLRGNTTLRHGRFSSDAAVQVLDWPPRAQPTVELAAAQFGGSPRVVERDDAVQQVLDAVGNGLPGDAREVFQSLAEVGLVVWFPSVH